MHVFGGGGARLRYLDQTTFREQWADTIVSWRPDFVLIWLGANDLNQNLNNGAHYDETHWLDCYQLHVELVNELRSRLGPYGARLIIMPLIPRTRLRYGMTNFDFFRSIRSFNLQFRRRWGTRLNDEWFRMNGYHAFREDGSALRDGVPLEWDILRAICQQVCTDYL